MWEWFNQWTPPQIIGLVTAISGGIAAWKLKGAAKPKDATSPTIDATGTVHNAKLAPIDRMTVERIKDDIGEVRRDIHELQSQHSKSHGMIERILDRMDLLLKK